EFLDRKIVSDVLIKPPSQTSCLNLGGRAPEWVRSMPGRRRSHGVDDRARERRRPPLPPSAQCCWRSTSSVTGRHPEVTGDDAVGDTAKAVNGNELAAKPGVRSHRSHRISLSRPILFFPTLSPWNRVEENR